MIFFVKLFAFARNASIVAALWPDEHVIDQRVDHVERQTKETKLFDRNERKKQIFSN